MTGVEFTNDYLQLIGQDFTGYAGGAAVLNSRYLSAMVNTVKKIYDKADNEREREYLRAFTIIANAHNAAAGANRVSLALPFNHLLYAAGTYSVHQRNLSVESFDLTKSPVEIVFNRQSNFRSTEFCTINLINSVVAPDTTTPFAGYLKQLTRTKYTLYLDKFLTVPSSASDFPLVASDSVTYSVWRKYINRKMKELHLDAKGEIGSKPNEWNPRFQMDKQTFTGGAFIMYPDNAELPAKSFVYWHSVKMDEMQHPTILIIADDNTVSLEATYNIELLYLIMQQASTDYAAEKRDNELYVTSNNETLQG